MSWIYLSHKLEESTPLYNDSGNIELKKIRKISDGDSCNCSEIIIPAHSGTHIDAPYHFDNEGKKICDYPAEFWITKKPSIIEYRSVPGNLLCLKMIKNDLLKVSPLTDILLIKTEAESWRGDGTDNYTKKGVGIDIDLADWIRINLDLKILGFDFISLSSPMHREIGRLAHQTLLSPHHSGKEPVLILEDLSLKDLKVEPKTILTIPLRFEDSDGAMATVLAEI
jgi:arylformamidase